MMKKGRLIVFEGIDGSGKDTQIDMLYNSLKEQGKKVKVVSQLDETSITGKTIRSMLEDGKEMGSKLRIALLYLTELTYNVEKEGGINDLLEQGYIVISNRFHYSTEAYVGHFGCEATDKVITTVQDSLVKPDLVIYLDVATNRAIDRLTGFKDFWEKKTKLEKIKNNYDKICSENKENNIIKVDNNWAPEHAAETISILLDKLK